MGPGQKIVLRPGARSEDGSASVACCVVSARGRLGERLRSVLGGSWGSVESSFL